MFKNTSILNYRKNPLFGMFRRHPELPIKSPFAKQIRAIKLALMKLAEITNLLIKIVWPDCVNPLYP